MFSKLFWTFRKLFHVTILTSRMYTYLYHIHIFQFTYFSFLHPIISSKLINNNSFQKQTKLSQSQRTFKHSLRFTPRQNRESSPFRGTMKRSRLPSRGPFRIICDESGANKVREACPYKASYSEWFYPPPLKFGPQESVNYLDGD